MKRDHEIKLSTSISWNNGDSPICLGNIVDWYGWYVSQNKPITSTPPTVNEFQELLQALASCSGKSKASGSCRKASFWHGKLRCVIFLEMSGDVPYVDAKMFPDLWTMFNWHGNLSCLRITWWYVMVSLKCAHPDKSYDFYVPLTYIKSILDMCIWAAVPPMYNHSFGWLSQILFRGATCFTCCFSGAVLLN